MHSAVRHLHGCNQIFTFIHAFELLFFQGGLITQLKNSESFNNEYHMHRLEFILNSHSVRIYTQAELYTCSLTNVWINVPQQVVKKLQAFSSHPYEPIMFLF